MSGNKDRMSFQVERIAFFSDAVFAIAITMMAIEVKAPQLPIGADNHDVVHALLHLLPEFIGVVLSFFFIGLLWYRHHQIMRHVASYNGRMVQLNFLLLLSVIFIPFSTAFVWKNLQIYSPLPLVIYNVNYMVTTWFNHRFFQYVFHQKHRLHDMPWQESRTVVLTALYFELGVFALVAIMAMLRLSIAPLFYSIFGLEHWVIGLVKKRSAGKPGHGH